MILVIPFRNHDPGHQLRFALRSITQHHNITRCILVGGKPRWYVGDHIPFPDYSLERKEENIRDKVIAGSEGVGEFLFSNDDIYTMAPVTYAHNKGLLSECLKGRHPAGSYTRLLTNTLNHYGDVPNADAHCPLMMTAEGVKRTNFAWPMWGLGFKTVYCQENNIPTTYYPDMKLDKPADVTGRLWFSVSDMFPVKHLHELFPHACFLEKEYIS